MLAITVTGSANLTGSQVIPSVATTAAGIMSLTVDTETGLADVTGNIFGLRLTDITFPAGTGLEFGAFGPFHIHNAPAGVNGPIVVPSLNMASFYSVALVNTGGSSSGYGGGGVVLAVVVSALGVPFPVEFIDELLAGNLYFNLHTLANGGGEIRGQISAVPEPGTGLLMAMGLSILGMRGGRRIRSGA